MILLSIACYAYCAAYIIASIVNGTLFADAPRLLYIITFAFFPFSYSIWSISDKDALRRASLSGSMIACYGALVLATVQHYALGMRSEGFAGNAIIFATVVCLAVMLCLAGILSGEKKLRIPLVGAMLAGALAIIDSGSRIVWIALPIGCLIICFVYRRELKDAVSKRGMMLIALGGVIIFALGFQVIFSRVDRLIVDWNALEASGHSNTSLGLRFALWDIGFKAFQELPAFGHGATNARVLLESELFDRYGIEKTFTHFHNGFVTVLVEAGLLGTIALAAIFVIAALNACKVLRGSCDPTERYGATMILAAVSTYLVCGMTGILVGHDILDSVLMIFLILGTYLSSGTSLAPPAGSGSA